MLSLYHTWACAWTGPSHTPKRKPELPASLQKIVKQITTMGGGFMRVGRTARPVRGVQPRGHTGRVTKVIFYLGLTAMLLFCLAPPLWFLDVSVQPDSTGAGPPTLIPAEITLENFRILFTHHIVFASQIGNSIIVSTASMVLAPLFGCPAAYAIARLRFRGRGVLLTALLAVFLLPPIALLGPLYTLFLQLHWIDTYQAIILPDLASTLPLTIWVLVASFRQLPLDVEEAAKVDGAGIVRTLFSVVLPLAAPGVGTAAIIAFINAWSDFIFPVAFTTTTTVRTITITLADLSAGVSVPWGVLTASALTVTIPLIVVAILVQRHIVAGLTGGAVKG